MHLRSKAEMDSDLELWFRLQKKENRVAMTTIFGLFLWWLLIISFEMLLEEFLSLLYSR